MCTRQFVSERACADSIRDGTHAVDPGWRLVPMRCDVCGGWHITPEFIPRPPVPCARKRQYTSLAFAEKLARRLSAERGQPLRAYKCPCGFYHLTSAPVRWWERED